MKPDKPRPGVLLCPANPDHGPLLETTSGRLMCIHQSHDGSPMKDIPQTPCYFSLIDAETAMKAREAAQA